jgi:hypothetical protein
MDLIRRLVGPEATIIDPAACWTSCFRCEP